MPGHCIPPSPDSSAARVAGTATVLAALTGTLGTLHLLSPRPFDSIIPPILPGPARWWTVGSGVVELGVAGLLAAPRTRRIGGAAATVLYVAVFPGNLQMAWNHRHGSAALRAISVARLPMQVPLVLAADRVRRA